MGRLEDGGRKVLMVALAEGDFHTAIGGLRAGRTKYIHEAREWNHTTNAEFWHSIYRGSILSGPEFNGVSNTRMILRCGTEITTILSLS